MVPVKITLSNFLSYGSEAQTLDFSRFHVACLSGRNGQGKSALLDALTWALWGEARKSSGAQKPDEELLRIGSRRMAVELVFDVEGDRYRVLRAYSRSATGKTSKSELELQLIDGETEESIPLTRASMRETQEVLTERLGLDYDAFVNSALLLQGRSDEFTKKKPSERKNILGRVLNLGRYDRLAEKARLRQSALRSEAEKLDREIEIFSEVLEHEKEWKGEFESTTLELNKKEDALKAVGAEVAALIENAATLQALKKELEAVEAATRQATQQRKVRQEEIGLLHKKIEEATQLIQQKETIQAEHAAYASFQKERDELDTKREVYRGLEAQLQAVKSSFAVKRTELEGKVEKLALELRVKEEEFTNAQNEVASKETYQRELEKSLEAKKSVTLLEENLRKQKNLDAEIGDLEQHIYGQKKQLSERLNGLREQIARSKKQVDEIAGLKKQLEDVSRKKDDIERVKVALSQTRDEGLGVAENISQLEGRISIIKEEIERVDVRIEQLTGTTESVCPTCGSLLDQERREALLKKLKTERSESFSQVSELSKNLDGFIQKRDTLRLTYRELSGQEAQMGKVVELFHQINERLGKAQESKKGYESDVQNANVLEQKLEKEEYALVEKKELIAKRSQRTQLELDDDALNKLRFEAAQTERYEERLRKIQFSEGKKENLQNQITKGKDELATLRGQLENGEAFLALKTQIKELESKLTRSGFDPERFEYIKKCIREKHAAVDNLHALLEAEKNIVEWEEQKEKLSGLLDELENSLGEKEERKIAIGTELKQLEELVARLENKKAEQKTIEDQVLVLQQAIGELKGRLGQVEEAKGKRKIARGKHKEKRNELNIYRKLRTAFGRNGIQSLIIEQALPEIEERASEILHRLTDGKMQVHLETIKDKKSGGTKETLEIIITDEQGVPRAYETYSGGEAFRINFALRIALSQMLAERNGVKIRTLGIDEGFGTQDEDGIQHLIEAIQEVQDDFDKILVITHLSRLKEAFPVRIEVVKDPVRGSQFTVMEQ